VRDTAEYIFQLTFPNSTCLPISCEHVVFPGVDGDPHSAFAIGTVTHLSGVPPYHRFSTPRKEF
jgi:hypothetical protein